MKSSSSIFHNLRIIHIGLIAGPIISLTICLKILKDRMLIENEIYYLVGLVIGIFAKAEINDYRSNPHTYHYFKVPF